MPNEARKPLCDYIIQQSETDGEDPPRIMALLNAMEVAEDAGHGTESIEPDDTDAEQVEDNPIGAHRQIERTAREQETAPDNTVTEVTPAPAGQRPTENDSVPIAGPSKQMPKQSHSPSQPFRILVPTPEEVHRVDTDLRLTPLGTWPTIHTTLTIPQQIALLDKYIARFEDDQLEVDAAGQEEIELATSQARQFEAEARMHEALGKKARAEGEAKATMWWAKNREAGLSGGGVC
ncbi:hypothetical protein E8E11_001398 [Didymella keratinophila]|nr:hypothetical protein E8E11_001398 [Didymella keratinophila]